MRRKMLDLVKDKSVEAKIALKDWDEVEKYLKKTIKSPERFLFLLYTDRSLKAAKLLQHQVPLTVLTSVAVHYGISFKEILPYFKKPQDGSSPLQKIIIKNNSKGLSFNIKNGEDSISSPLKMTLHPHFKTAPHEIAELMSLYDVIPEDSDSKKSPADLLEDVGNNLEKLGKENTHMEEVIFLKKTARLASLSLSASPAANEIRDLITSIKEEKDREDWKPLLNILIRFAESKTNISHSSVTHTSAISIPAIPVPRSSPLQKSSLLIGARS
jgi:hypothetical protein